MPANNTTFIFEAEEPLPRGGGAREHHRLAVAVRDAGGAWIAVLRTEDPQKAQAMASRINCGRFKAWSSVGRFEGRSGTTGQDEHTVWARWAGDDA